MAMVSRNLQLEDTYNYYSTIMSFYHIRLRENAKYEAVIHCSVLVSPVYNRANTGGCKGRTMAELDEPVDESKIENRSQNNIFGGAVE